MLLSPVMEPVTMLSLASRSLLSPSMAPVVIEPSVEVSMLLSPVMEPVSMLSLASRSLLLPSMAPVTVILPFVAESTFEEPTMPSSPMAISPVSAVTLFAAS